MALNGANKSAAVQVSVGTSATLLSAGRPTGGVIYFENQSSTDIYIGTSAVTTSAGKLLRAKSSTVLDSYSDSISTDAWYGIVASGTANLLVQETY